MPAKLHEQIRRDIIQGFLEGHPRNAVATKCKVSTGSATNIFDEWRNSTGPELADILRELSMAMRRLGMSPTECATGMRMVNLFRTAGYEERSAELFLSEVYTRIQDLGITPAHIAGYVKGFISILDNLNPNISIRSPMITLLDIDKIMENNAEYLHSLEERVTVLENRLQDIRRRISSDEDELNDVVQREASIKIDLQWKSDLRDQLQREGIAVDSITKLAEYAHFFTDNGFSINELLRTFSNYRKLQDDIAAQGLYVESLKGKAQELRDKNEGQENVLQEYSLKVAELETIKGMGFGLSELKRLHSILDEISADAGLSTEKYAAVKRFFRELEGYDDFLNMGKKIDERKAKLQELSEAIKFTSAALNLMPEVAGLLKYFVRLGLRKDDMENVKRIVGENLVSIQSKSKVNSQGSKDPGETIVNIAKSDPIAGIRETNVNVKRSPDAQAGATSASAEDDGVYHLQANKRGKSKPLYPSRIKFLRSGRVANV